MPQVIEVPGIGNVEFPDGMSNADMESAIKNHFQSQQPSLGASSDIQDANIIAAGRMRRSVPGGHGTPQTRTGGESVGSLEQVMHGTPLGFFADETPAGAAYKQEHPFASEALKWGGGGALTAPMAAPVIGAVGRAGG